jgi:hypothetical protein
MDFAAVTRILAPITEDLNDSAAEAMYPSPPINTPVFGSPTPSLINRYPIRHHRGTDVTSSNRSVEASAADCDDCEMASISEVLSEDCKDKDCPGHPSTSLPPPLLSPLGTGSVPIALGSPTVNPRIEEYLSFTSKDLPTQAPPPVTGATLAEHASSTSTTALDGNSLRSRVSFKSDGVTERSNWAEELEDSVDRTCLRLEQLAADEHKEDPSKTIEEYYIARLRRLLGNKKRQVPVKIAVTKDAQKKV